MSNIIFNRSIFKKYFDSDDSEALIWAENVLDKLVEKGIIANYIEREHDGAPNDFEELYRPIAIFFSYLVRLAREFESFKDNDFLADQYLENKGHFTCGDESLDQLAYGITNLLRRRSQRGSIKQIEKINVLGSDGSMPDGELLSLLCWDYFSFFKLGVARPQYNSWNIGHSGPLYRGNTGRYDLNIGYEYTEGVKRKSAYPLINENYVFLTTYRGKECLEIEQVPFGQVAGIGASDRQYEIIIDPRLNYEITFQVAQDITLENITFGVKAFDRNGDAVNLQNIVTGNNDNFFFETRRLNKAGSFYFVRGIIYNKDKSLLTADEAMLNIGFGQNLRFTNDVVSIIPYIVMDNDMTDDSDSEQDNFDSDSYAEDQGYSGYDSSIGSWSDPVFDGDASVFLHNIKVTPCNLNYNRCYLDNKNFIDVYVVNNNGKHTDEEINIILRKYFIPYNTAFKVTHIGAVSEIAPDLSYLLLEDGSYILLENEGRILLESN